ETRGGGGGGGGVELLCFFPSFWTLTVPFLWSRDPLRFLRPIIAYSFPLYLIGLFDSILISFSSVAENA
ncbi:unnamed protein product, partial [Musa acuminata subsp. burmannicoides]